MPRGKKTQNAGVKLRQGEVEDLRNRLSALPDNREAKKPVYPLAVLFTMLVYAALCGYEGPSGAELFCKRQSKFLTQVFGLKRTRPSPPSARR